MEGILKPLRFVGSSQDDLRGFPAAVRHALGLELMRVQFGGMPVDFKSMPTVGSGAYEVRVHIDGAWRVVYVAKFASAIYVLHAFPEENAAHRQDRHRTGEPPIQADSGARTMTTTAATATATTLNGSDPRWDDARIVEGSGNVFLDLGFDPAEAEVMALRAEVMLRIEQHLKGQGWTQKEAARRLGITQPRISRLVKGVWQDFSLDMLLTLAARSGLRAHLTLAA